MSHDVFISYSAEDKTIADALCAKLEESRIRCWIAPRNILPGETYAEAIIDAIDASRIMVLVFSSHANASKHVMREVQRGVHNGIPIIPFRIEEVHPSSAMEYDIGPQHWLDAMTPPLESHLRKLADVVNFLLKERAGESEGEIPEVSALGADNIEFIERLIGFGLSEQEARLYLHLLKHGSKALSQLEKSFKMYREDVHRTLTGLIDKGMVNPSLEEPTVYTAVELDFALEGVLKKHESELREMEMRKIELQELAQQQRFRPSDEVTTFKIIKSLKEMVGLMIPLFNSLEEEFLACMTPNPVVFCNLYDIAKAGRMLIARGGKVRIISNISYLMIEQVQQQLDNGEDVRHYDKYNGIMFSVFDRKCSISQINADNAKLFSLDERISALYTDDPSYAKNLVSTFEILWEQAVPAAQQIEELLKEGPLSV